jgi:hypothetical protein
LIIILPKAHSLQGMTESITVEYTATQATFDTLLIPHDLFLTPLKQLIKQGFEVKEALLARLFTIFLTMIIN